MASLTEKVWILNSEFDKYVSKKILNYVGYPTDKIMDDLSNIINEIHNEEKLINDSINNERIRIEEEVDDFLTSYYLEDDIYELEILDDSIHRKNINKHLEFIIDYFEKNKIIINNIIKKNFNLDMKTLYDCNIYTLYSDLSSEEFEVCSNHKFKSFLIELDEIFRKWSIDYINYESDYDDYIEY
jgi:hypothetical protein